MASINIRSAHCDYDQPPEHMVVTISKSVAGGWYKIYKGTHRKILYHFPNGSNVELFEDTTGCYLFIKYL